MRLVREIQLSLLALWGLGALSVFLSTAALAASGDFVADAVLGQPNLTSGAAGNGATGLNVPFASAVDPTSGRIYVCDLLNHRVLAWPSAAAYTNGQAADMVLGQNDFTSVLVNQGGLMPTSTSLNTPSGVAVDKSGNVYVADRSNNRVLLYLNPSVSPGVAAGKSADIVFGQAAFNTATAAAGPSGLSAPQGVALDASGRLFVADSMNHRVLAFNAPLTSDTVADKVWGQPDFAQNMAGVTNATLNGPVAICFDALDNLYISEYFNSRVMEYDKGYNATTTVATRVFGQPSFNAGTIGLSNGKMNGAQGIAIDINGSLYAADTGNNRILIFDSPLSVPLNNAGTATRVIGQIDFMSKASGTSATAFNAPYNITLDAAGNGYVTEASNHRVLRFDGLVIDPAPVTQFTSSDDFIIPVTGVATPYPSILSVGGVAGSVTKVTVTLKHLSHTFPTDLDIFLVGPGGQGVKLLSDSGSSSFDLNSVNLTFDDAAAAALGSTQIVNGTYKPSEFAGSVDIAVFTNFGTALSVYNGVNPNGDWKLYVIDDNMGDFGSMHGWGLNIYTTPALTGPTATPGIVGVGKNVEFNVTAAAAPGDALTYTWDFGDGSMGTGAKVAHAYAAAGTFMAKVTVTAAVGGAMTGMVAVQVAAPALASGPTAAPNPATTGQMVTFAAVGTDAANLALSYAWDFGDGSNGSGAAVTHAYAAAGSFTAAVTVSDGGGVNATGSVGVTVTAPVIAVPLIGTGADTDGDGFSDGYETIAGTDPQSAASTPTGGATAKESLIDLPDVKLSIALSFSKKKTGADSISLSGTLIVPAGFVVNGSMVTVDVGGVMKTFKLDAKGAAKTGGDSFKAGIKGGPATAKFSAKLSKGNFSAALADEGLTNAAASGKSVVVKAMVLFGAKIFVKNQALSYSAKVDSSGKTKQGK